VAGQPFDPALLASLEGLANRGYTDGFYQRHHDADYQNYLRGHSESTRNLYVGDVVRWDEARQAVEIRVKNRFSVGDRLEVLLPQGNFDFKVEKMLGADGENVLCAAGDGHFVWLPLTRETVGAYLARYV
jgi:putative protease